MENGDRLKTVAGAFAQFMIYVKNDKSTPEFFVGWRWMLLF